MPEAELGFRPGRSCRANGCSLLLEGQAPIDLDARIDGLEVPTTHDDAGVLVPITAAQAAKPDGVWLTLTRRSGRPLGIRMTGLTLTKGHE